MTKEGRFPSVGSGNVPSRGDTDPIIEGLQ